MPSHHETVSRRATVGIAALLSSVSADDRRAVSSIGSAAGCCCSIDDASEAMDECDDEVESSGVWPLVEPVVLGAGQRYAASDGMSGALGSTGRGAAAGSALCVSSSSSSGMLRHSQREPADIRAY